MIRCREADRINYLVRRKFPFEAMLASTGSIRGGIFEDTSEAAKEKIAAYKAELEAKPPEELLALHEQEKEKERQELKAKEHLEEQQRFFNQPNANADFEYWSKMTHWSLDEAIALAFGKAPEFIKWERVKGYVNISPFAAKYARIRDLALRALTWQQLFDPVLPGIFLAWAKRTDIEVPAELVRLVEARGGIVADWKDRYDQLKAQFDEQNEVLDKQTKDHKKLLLMCEKLIEERNVLRQRLKEKQLAPNERWRQF